ncbi:MAG: sulfatase [Verrucomicrobia bacterium]|nr:sulfatase [Verrucomicrobiota bacterium]
MALLRSLLVCGLVGTVAFMTVPAQVAQDRKPNLVIFLADDVGYGEFGFQGNAEIPTPNIDSLAQQGIRFSQGYVSGPYCSPTRAGLLTGRYQTRFGHEFNGGGAAGGVGFGLPLTEKTMADRFKAIGYATVCIGKWHLGGPPDFLPIKRGFDEFYGTVANTAFFKPQAFVDSLKSAAVQPIADEAFYTTDAYAERAVDWIDRHRDRPFLLYLPFNAQHAPLQATPRYLERFGGIADEKRRTFAAMMSAMDDAVGRVLAKLRDLRLEENTLIWFFSDNGGPTPSTTSKNGPLRGFKATTLEGGVRVPFCVQWKGHLPAGKVYEAPIIQLDILPTSLAAAGVAVDPAWGLDGVNLLPFLTGQAAGRPHPALYWRFGDQWAVRKGDWKLVAARPDNLQTRLFNLAVDLGEANDLSAVHTDKVKELKADWDAWNVGQKEPLWRPAAAGAKAKQKQAGKKKARP